MILKFPAPAEAPSINKVLANHWRTTWQTKKAWQHAAKVHWMNFLPAGERHLGPCTIKMTIPFKRGARRDPHNWVGSVVKWTVDGLVKGGAWPDDTSEWVTVLEPELVVDKTLTVRIAIEAR